MLKLKMVWAGVEKFDVTHEIFYRALRKVISEGRDTHFGGMTEAGVARSNRLYLFYRDYDRMPVVAISILEEVTEEYEDVLEGISRKHTNVLNAVAVRPELWGQGFARQAVDMCLKELQEKGIEAVVGRYALTIQ